MAKTMKEILKKEQDAISILQDTNLLYNIIQEVKKKVAGNEDVILALIVKICLRFVENANPTSSNVLISDDSGSGKDWITKCVCDVLVSKKQYEHVTDISDKLLNYWTIPKKYGGTFDGYVLHLEDPSPDRIKSQAFKVRASGENAVRFVDRGKAKVVHIEGKPVLLVTSMLATIDTEGARRWDSLRMDKSKRVTQLMKKMYAKVASGELDQSPNEMLRRALQTNINRKQVIVPYAPVLIEVLPDTLIMRTQQQKLMDYIKASAVLHQFQRNRTCDGKIIATLSDYDYARFCFITLGDLYGIVLSKAEEEVVKVLTEHGVIMPIRNIQAKCSMGKDWLYQHLPELKEKGLLIEDSPFDDLANKPVQCYGIHPEYNMDKSSSLPTVDELIEIIKNEKSQQKNPIENLDSTEKSSQQSRPEKVKSVKSENQDDLLLESGCRQFQGCLCKINKYRINIEKIPALLHPLNSRKPTQYNNNKVVSTEVKKGNLVFGNGTRKPQKTIDNQTNLSLFQQIRNLRNYIAENQKSGFKIDMLFLEHKYSKDFIRHCIDNNVIRKKGDDEWEMA